MMHIWLDRDGGNGKKWMNEICCAFIQLICIGYSGSELILLSKIEMVFTFIRFTM